MTSNSSDTFAVSFGIEFEFVFAFHENELRRTLDDYGIEAQIIKDPPEECHRELLWQHLLSNRRRRYPSWVLQVPSSDPFFQAAFVAKCREPWASGGMRRCAIEPLLIAKRLLDTSGLPVCVMSRKLSKPVKLFEEVKLEEVCYSRPLNYNKWTLMNDYSIIGATKGELRSKLPGLINEHNQSDWDSYGLELVTRIFQYSDRTAACREVHKYLATLRHERATIQNSPTENDSGETSTPDTTPQNHAAFDSVFAGTHIHVGFDLKKLAKSDYLNFLQHLAFIILTHEELISALHPKPRRGLGRQLSPLLPREDQPFLGETPLQFEQRLQEEEEDHVARMSSRFAAVTEIQSNREYFIETTGLPPQPTVTDFAAAVWSPSHTDVESLGNSLNDPVHRRVTIVYFGNLIDALRRVERDRDQLRRQRRRGRRPRAPRTSEPPRETEKPTIEFRQHGCTLDAAEIWHWLTFLFALVRLAERKAGQPIPPTTTSEPESKAVAESSKYPATATTSTRTFCGPDFLDLPTEEVEYWVRRYEMYADDGGEMQRGGGGSSSSSIRARRISGKYRIGQAGTGMVTRATGRRMGMREAWRMSELERLVGGNGTLKEAF